MIGRGRGKRDDTTPTRYSVRQLGLQAPSFEESALKLTATKQNQTLKDAGTHNDSEIDEQLEANFEDALDETPLDSDNMATICPVSTFWREKPSLWFIQTEALFEKHKVTDDMAKFNTVVGALDAGTIEDLQDIISAPPAADRYKTLKDAIIKRTSESPDATLLKLLTNLQLGDSPNPKPSQLWRKMTSMANGKILEPALKVMWLAHLPSPAQTYLSVLKVDSMQDLLDAADKIISHNTQVTAVTDTGSSSATSSGYCTPVAAITPEQQQLAALQTAIAQLIAITRQSLERSPQGG